jgi:Rod binding domain-containing protein
MHPGGLTGATPAPRKDSAVEQACQEMEALFLKQLLAAMRRAGGSMMNGPGGEVYQELFDQELSRQLAQASALGVARMLHRELGPAATPGTGSKPAAAGTESGEPAGLKRRQASSEA